MKNTRFGFLFAKNEKPLRRLRPVRSQPLNYSAMKLGSSSIVGWRFDASTGIRFGSQPGFGTAEPPKRILSPTPNVGDIS